MSRIYEALARARALGAAEVERQPGAEIGLDDGSLPPTPAEWATEPPVSSRPKVRQARTEVSPPHVEVAAPKVGSNGNHHNTEWVFSEKLKEKLVVGNGIDHAALEQYRRLAAVLHLTQRERGDKAKIVMISSALSAEGKTLTCVNLALTLSESYQRSVLLVDSDLRRPWLHEVFQMPNVGGLNDSMTSSDSKIPIRQISPRLSLLTAGSPAPDPMRVLASARMDHVLEQARSQFDWVLLDTPPVTLLTDASLVACKADLVVLVVQAGRTGYDVVQRAVDAVGRDRVVGIVLNRAKGGPASEYAAGYYAAADPATRDTENT
jgi:protein-tyrosine kinase